MNSCRNIFDDLNLTGGSNASLLMSHYLKKLDDQSASRIELFTAMKGAAVKVNPLYSRAFMRRQNILKDIATPKYFKTSRPLVAGLGNSNVLETGLSLNPTYGLPMIPASTIKGITAHYCATVLGSENEDYKGPVLDDNGRAIIEAGKIYAALFGKIYPKEEQEAGFLRFYDAWITPKTSSKPFIDDVMTPHHSEYYVGRKNLPTDFDDPTPVRFLAVEGEFEFWISCEDSDEKQREGWIKFAFDLLTEALKNYGIGGKLQAGYGKMESVLSKEEQQKKIKETENKFDRQSGFAYSKGDEVTVVCTKVKKTKHGEKRTFEFTDDYKKDGKIIRFGNVPEKNEGETVKAKITSIDKNSNCYYIEVI